MKITIYNSRNYIVLLDAHRKTATADIYNSRNYIVLLDHQVDYRWVRLSTIVEIILSY